MSLVDIAVSGAVRTVTLARPDKRNAINPQMMASLREAFERPPAGAERVTVIRAQGTAFCAGLELSTSGVDRAEAERIEAMFDAVQRYPLPVVAVVQGPAIAGGCELALHADFIVAAEDAPFAMPLAQLGVSTTWFLTKKLVEFAGPATAREFLLLGEPLPAARLHALGIVTRAVAGDALAATADRLVERLAGNAPLAMRAMKRQLVAQMDFLLDVEHDDIDAEVAAVFASTDALEGVAARVQRRQPDFEGR